MVAQSTMIIARISHYSMARLSFRGVWFANYCTTIFVGLPTIPAHLPTTIQPFVPNCNHSIPRRGKCALTEVSRSPHPGARKCTVLVYPSCCTDIGRLLVYSLCISGVGAIRLRKVPDFGSENSETTFDEYNWASCWNKIVSVSKGSSRKKTGTKAQTFSFDKISRFEKVFQLLAEDPETLHRPVSVRLGSFRKCDENTRCQVFADFRSRDVGPFAQRLLTIVSRMGVFWENVVYCRVEPLKEKVQVLRATNALWRSWKDLETSRNARNTYSTLQLDSV